MATTSETPKAQKTLKPKDSSKKKSSSKKRAHEEHESAKAAAAAVQTTSSPSKRQRTKEPVSAAAEDDEEEEAQSAPISTPSNAYKPTDADMDKHSPFVQQTTSLYLPLAPVAHRFPLQGLCAEHLSPYLLTYYPPLNGVLLSYSNPRLSSTPHDPSSSSSSSSSTSTSTTSPATAGPTVLAMAKSIAEYAPTYVWLTADFTLLRPTRSSCIEGHVALQNESYLALTCYNYFAAGIPRSRLPSDWVWVSAADKAGSAASSTATSNLVKDWMRGGRVGEGAGTDGWFVDGRGKKVEGVVRFRVRDFESQASGERERGFMSVEGSLLDDEGDAKVDKEEREKAKGKAKGSRRLGR